MQPRMNYVNFFKGSFPQIFLNTLSHLKVSTEEKRENFRKQHSVLRSINHPLENYPPNRATPLKMKIF